MSNSSTLEKTLVDFASVTAKSKIAVVVPLFGYWKDAKSDQLNIQTIKIALDRIYSNVHQIYIIFVAEASRLPDDVSQLLITASTAGNAVGVQMPRGSSYGDYLREGFARALETEAQYILSINPWVMLQHNAIDVMVDRINRDDAKIVSGFELRGVIDSEDFASHHNHLPMEERVLCIDFFGMKRFAAEMIGLDENYKTHSFIARDIFQAMYTKGFDVITSERIPIFGFDVDWRDLETREDFVTDQTYFVKKWRFDPGLKYEKE
jgi:hypothetical protein